jgi:hypothetical protein
VDRRLRTRYRDLLEDPADPERVAALRGTLAHADPADAAPLRDELIGAYYAGASWENLGAPERRHLRFSGPGLLAPQAPGGATLSWRQAGTLVGVNHAVVLVEDPSGALIALALDSGERLWRVPSAFEGAEPLDPSQGRRERLGWAAPPVGQGSVELGHDLDRAPRRRGPAQALTSTLTRV